MQTCPSGDLLPALRAGPTSCHGLPASLSTPESQQSSVGPWTPLPLGPFGALLPRLLVRMGQHRGVYRARPSRGPRGPLSSQRSGKGRHPACPWQKVSTHREHESLSQGLDLPPGLRPKRAFDLPLLHPGEGRALLTSTFLGVITGVITSSTFSSITQRLWRACGEAHLVQRGTRMPL